MPKIGYGSDNTTKYFLPNGLKKFVVHNASDLNVLLMNNRTFCGEIAHIFIDDYEQTIRVSIHNTFKITWFFY